MRAVDRIADSRRANHRFSFAENCLIGTDASKYFYVAQGMLTIDGIDDTEEMKLTDEAMDILGFTQVCLAIRLKRSEKSVGHIRQTIGREGQLVPMYSGYHALW